MEYFKVYELRRLIIPTIEIFLSFQNLYLITNELLTIYIMYTVYMYIVCLCSSLHFNSHKSKAE